MLQLCTAATDGNPILGYWPQTSHPLLQIPIIEGQMHPRKRLIAIGLGFGEEGLGVSLPSSVAVRDLEQLVVGFY